MKNVIITVLLIAQGAVAQVQGNQNIITQSFDIENVQTVSVQMYAKVTIDASLKSAITITADQNLIQLIGKEVKDGTLTLDQKQWINPSRPIQITIGAFGLKKLIHGTHDTTQLVGLNQEQLIVEAPIGAVSLAGNVTRLTLTIKDAKIALVTAPKQLVGDYTNKKVTTASKSKVSFINIKLKNNSLTRSKFVVRGPNGRGENFAYGFSIFPGFSKSERWSIGTKIFLAKSGGVEELLYTLTPDDANSTIKLF